MIYDCIIIGSGVAGLTSALYIARAGKSVLVIENANIGGVTATIEKIDNYPGMPEISGADLVSALLSQVLTLGVNIKQININSIDFDKKCIYTKKEELNYKTLIVASGSSYNRLNIDDEDKYIYNGLSYCAVCDGSLYKDKEIVVVTKGNIGNSSIEYLKNITTRITIIDVIDEYKSNDFTVINNAKIKSINGKDNVESIDVVYNNNVSRIKCDGLFVCLGKSTNLSLYQDKLDNDGMYICSDENMHTNLSSVFVAGDIRKKTLRQIITACADGAIAGTEAIKYLNNN